MPIQYHDFDLLIERSGDGFKARVLDSPAGEATAQIQVPFTQADLENFYTQIGHTRLVETSQMQKMRTFGQELFEATFTGTVRDKFKESLAEVNRKQEGLRIRLRLVDVPELANMPWEFMYDESLNRFLTLSVDTPLVRYLDVPREIQPLTVRPPLKILTVISSPRNFPTLNVQKEWGNLQEALSRLEGRDLVRLTLLEKPTLQALQRQLRRDDYHVFHFIGHGIFSKHFQDGQLLFEDELKGGDPVSSRDLGILLHDHRQLRLAVLNACEGARTSMEDQFSGTAQSLIRQGLPAVIAMQFRITDIAAITLAREFYAALADGYPVDASLTEARKSIKTHGNELEWGTPVLYMRSPNGQIFDVESIRQTTTSAAQPDPIPDPESDRQLTLLYTEGLEAFYLKEWDKAVTKFEAILAIQSNHKDASAKLDLAQRQLNLSSLDQKAQSAESKSDWASAIKALEALSKELPEQASFPSRLENARKQHRLNNLYAEARQLSKAKKWLAVIQVFHEIHSLDADYPDPDNLLSTAEEGSAAQELKIELESMYQNALQAIGANEWLTARDTLQSIQSRQEKYRQTEKLLERANNEIARIERDAQEQEQITSLYLQAENLASRKQWNKALEKLEEIHKLQPDFEDPEQVEVQARSELDKAKEETEKQEHLAKLYAKAIKFNQTGEFQQALDQWNEIRSIDSTYPDKQKVQATAKRMLKKGKKTTTPITLDVKYEQLLRHPTFIILVISFLWAVIYYGVDVFTDNLQINGVINSTANTFLSWFTFGILTGLGNAYLLKNLKIDLPNEKRWLLIGGWTASTLVIPIILTIFPNFTHRYIIGYTCAGILYGLALHLSLPEIEYRPSASTLLFSFGFGMFAGDASFVWFRDNAGLGGYLSGASIIFFSFLIATTLAFRKTITGNAEETKVGVGNSVLSIAGIIISARWLGNVIEGYIEATVLPSDMNWDSSPYVIANLSHILFAALATWFILRYLKNRLNVPVTRRDMVLLSSFWVIGMIATSFLAVYLTTEMDTVWGWRIGWSTGGVIIGLGTWLATKKYSLRNKSVYLVNSILGWGGGFSLSELILGPLQELFTPIVGGQFSWHIAINLNVGIAGLIGGLVLFMNLADKSLFVGKVKDTTEVQIGAIPNRHQTIWDWLKIFIVFALSRTIIDVIIFNTGLFDLLERSISNTVALSIYFILFGFSTGSAIWLMLRKKYVSPSWKTWLFLSLTSSISLAVFFTGVLLAKLGTWSWTAAWVFIGICVGLALTSRVRNMTPALPKALFWQLPLIWIVSFVVGQQFASEVSLLKFGILDFIKDNITRAVETALYGVIGGLLTIKLLEFDKKQFAVTLRILFVLLIFFAFATGLQAFQKSFIDEPFAGAIGDWEHFNQNTISIRRSLFTGQYQITYVDRVDSRCNNKTSTATYTAEPSGRSRTLTSLVRFHCEATPFTTFGKTIQLIYNPDVDALSSSYGSASWQRK